MTVLPSHLDRTLHAACGATASGAPPAVDFDEIVRQMADPPSAAELREWLDELTRMKLLRRLQAGWAVTDEGWRAVNLIPSGDDSPAD